jgi:hypothetical protein
MSKWQSMESTMDAEYGCLRVALDDIGQWEWDVICGLFTAHGFSDSRKEAKREAEWAYAKLAAIVMGDECATEH